MSRFDYVKYDTTAVADQDMFKGLCLELEERIVLIGSSLGPDGQAKTARSKAAALTKLEECYMWIGKAVRDDQVQRNIRDGVKTPLQEDRKNG